MGSARTVQKCMLVKQTCHKVAQSKATNNSKKMRKLNAEGAKSELPKLGKNE